MKLSPHRPVPPQKGGQQRCGAPFVPKRARARAALVSHPNNSLVIPQNRMPRRGRRHYHVILLLARYHANALVIE
jgi:hypothetical protein